MAACVIPRMQTLRSILRVGYGTNLSRPVVLPSTISSTRWLSVSSMYLQAAIAKNAEKSDQSTDNKPANSATLAAFVARSGFNFSSRDLLMQALTHKSFDNAKVPHNERLEYLGEKAIDFFVVEYVHTKYPNLSRETIKDAVRMYVGMQSLGSVGRNFGVQDVMRWTSASPTEEVSMSMLSKTVKALVGALFHDRGGQAAKNFVHAAILSRTVDMEAVVQLQEPKRLLSALMRRQDKEQPMSRLLKETGRLSNAPVFVVGVYSGSNKLGEGFGSSIKMAEHRAAKDAILKHFLAENTRPMLPSETLGLADEAQTSFL